MVAAYLRVHETRNTKYETRNTFYVLRIYAFFRQDLRNFRVSYFVNHEFYFITFVFRERVNTQNVKRVSCFLFRISCFVFRERVNTQLRG